MEEIKAVTNWELDDDLYTEFTSLRRRAKSAERTLVAVNRIRGARGEMEAGNQSTGSGAGRPKTAGSIRRGVHRRQSEIDRRKDKHFLKVGLTLEDALVLSKNGTAEDLLMENLGVIRTRIKADRIENNKVCGDLRTEEQALQNLKITLQDLEGEGKAVGMRAVTEEVTADADNPSRLEQQSSISRRQVYTKESGMQELERELAQVLESTEESRKKCETYTYLKERLEREAIQGNITTQRLESELDGAQRQYKMLKERVQSSTRELSTRQLELEKLEYGMGREFKLWEREIKWLKTKAETNDLCNQIVADHIDYQSALNAKASSGNLSNLSAKEERSLVRKFVKGRLGKNMSNKSLDQKLKQFNDMHFTYEEVCQQLGTTLEHFDPEVITAPITEYDQFVAQMDASDDAERDQLQELTQEIAARQEELKSSSFSGEYEEGRRSTTNRALTEAENECTSAHKQLEITKDEYGYLMEQLQPVAMGIRSLVRRIPSIAPNLREIVNEDTETESGGKAEQQIHVQQMLGHQLLHMDALAKEVQLFKDAAVELREAEAVAQAQKLKEIAADTEGTQQEPASEVQHKAKGLGFNIGGAALEGIRALKKAKEESERQAEGGVLASKQAYLKHNVRVNSSLKLPKYVPVAMTKSPPQKRVFTKMSSMKKKLKVRRWYTLYRTYHLLYNQLTPIINEPHPQPATNPQCFSSTTNPQCFPRHFHYDSAQSNRRITGKSMRQMAHTKVLHLVTSTKSDTQTPAPTRCSIHKCVFTSAYSQVRIHTPIFSAT
jgi:hypothetical protein